MVRKQERKTRKNDERSQSRNQVRVEVGVVSPIGSEWEFVPLDLNGSLFHWIWMGVCSIGSEWEFVPLDLNGSLRILSRFRFCNSRTFLPPFPWPLDWTAHFSLALCSSLRYVIYSRHFYLHCNEPHRRVEGWNSCLWCSFATFLWQPEWLKHSYHHYPSMKFRMRMARDRLNELSFTFLYFNLGGEMMYIINQRLIAQQTSPDKSQRGKRWMPSCSLDFMSLLSSHRWHSGFFPFPVPPTSNSIHGFAIKVRFQLFEEHVWNDHILITNHETDTKLLPQIVWFDHWCTEVPGCSCSIPFLTPSHHQQPHGFDATSCFGSCFTNHQPCQEKHSNVEPSFQTVESEWMECN